MGVEGRLDEIAKVFSNKSWVKILSLISREPMTVSELEKEIKGIKRRESIYKALEFMRELGLVERKISEEKGAQEYETSFERVVINDDGSFEVQEDD